MEVAQSCTTVCDPMDYSLPGFFVHGILQARTLEWVAISFSRQSYQSGDKTRVSRIVGRHFTIWATREALFGPYACFSSLRWISGADWVRNLSLRSLFPFHFRSQSQWVCEGLLSVYLGIYQELPSPAVPCLPIWHSLKSKHALAWVLQEYIWQNYSDPIFL